MRRGCLSCNQPTFTQNLGHPRIAYAIWSGVGIVLITIIGWGFFGQKLDIPALVGISLIIAGVVTMNVFSNSGH